MATQSAPAAMPLQMSAPRMNPPCKDAHDDMSLSLACDRPNRLGSIMVELAAHVDDDGGAPVHSFAG